MAISVEAIPDMSTTVDEVAENLFKGLKKERIDYHEHGDLDVSHLTPEQILNVVANRHEPAELPTLSPKVKEVVDHFKPQIKRPLLTRLWQSIGSMVTTPFKRPPHTSTA
jgi:hypothetical protein